MSEETQGAHRAGAEPAALDLDPEVEQTWLRPRGSKRYPAASPALDPADSTDTYTQLEPVVAPLPAVSAVSREAGASVNAPRSGRRANSTSDPAAEAAERLAADRATVAAQGEALRRAAQRRREAEAVRPPPSVEGGVQQVVPPVVVPRHGAGSSPSERRLVAGGVYDRPLDGTSPARSAHAAGPESVAAAALPDVTVPAPTPLVAPMGPAAARAAAAAEAAAVAAARAEEAARVATQPPATATAPISFLEAQDPASRHPEPVDVATRAIVVVRQAGPGPSSTATAHPYRPSRTLVMGILNVTLDSFSDGGRYARFDDAVAHARSMVAAGADIIDVGGESTRPGAPRVAVQEEQRRVVPVIRELVSLGFRVSIDTMNAATAYAAAEAGADIINDVSGGLADKNMARVVADTDRTYIAMHWRGHSDTMESRAVYGDAVAEVKAELFQRVAEMVVQGVNPDRIVIDPGLGFAKKAEHNWQLLAHLDELAELGLPILVAASRKRFLGGLLPEDAPVRERDPATAVISALAAQVGAWGVRVHDVASTRAALDVWESWQKGSRG
ncbi:MAG: dihydropteroate synthase [Frondihabitans sp.]|nr:dihydropteroate synthase [Frondihabitans sp.]